MIGHIYLWGVAITLGASLGFTGFVAIRLHATHGEEVDVSSMLMGALVIAAMWPVGVPFTLSFMWWSRRHPEWLEGAEEDSNE